MTWDAMIHDLPEWLERLWQAAQDIREVTPIEVTATDADCVERGLLIGEWLGEHGITIFGRRVWHSVLLEDGRAAGMWADNADEAALNVMVWHGQKARLAVEDPECVAYNAWRAANGLTVTVAASGAVVPSGGLLDGLGEWA